MLISKVLHPEVLYAQRANELYLTINVTDCKDPKINVTKDKISFAGKAGPEQNLYGFELEFYKEVNPETSKRSTTARNIFLVLDKSVPDQSYWPRLQKEKGKVSFLKTDFSKWKDEDEEEEEGASDPLGGMDFSSLVGGEGADPGLGDDSDDEVPDLETVNDTTKINNETKTNEQETTKPSEEIKDEESESKKE
ncbi:8451_t:CDS:2 [Funneliformis geosporum]|uniref:18836_t:CDS:1 n=1 Tax=Funneliformis geosporum TaxID=1117311 RepID=A0A9W4SZL4_9GLOM|nr:18836_t:CDS:2 [Funneliformis geosporum]CAI2186609.1 8451_t:CDS:2 [Funneliformis geosporum]